MLCLSRRINEVIRIGSGIEVKVLEIRHGRVKLGFTAPKEVPVHRKEIYEAIKRQEKSK